MQYVDEFRNKSHVQALADRIRDIAESLDRTVRFMEVCGGHTMAIHRFGLPELLPDNVELISGPGCPVCVTATSYIDTALQLAEEGALLTTFGDLYRVPGSDTTLERAASQGATVEIVYSPHDALTVANNNPDRDVVFLAVGFETTVPTVAATLMEASETGLSNFHLLSGHKTMPQALRALVEAPDVSLDGFILPGHVSTITGLDIYTFLADEFNIPCCVSGFEPSDMMQTIESLLEQCAGREATVDNAYGRAVQPEGNPQAQSIVEHVFEPADAVWRGIGLIPDSGLALRNEWSKFSCGYRMPFEGAEEPPGCECGEVLRGNVRPPECPLFGSRCTPDSPVGPCMVSSEGSCAAHYKYGSQE